MSDRKLLKTTLVFIMVFLQPCLVLSQTPEQKQKVLITDFVKKLNHSDTADLSMLIQYRELSEVINSVDNHMAALILEKARDDKKFLKLLEEYSFECTYSGLEKRMPLSKEDLKRIHTFDTLSLQILQERLKKLNDRILNRAFQSYLDYRDYILSKGEGKDWEKLLGSKMCPEEVIREVSAISSLYKLPAMYKRYVGNFRNVQAEGGEVVLREVIRAEIYNEKGLLFSEPTLVLGSTNSEEEFKLKLQLVFLNNKWKIYREF